MKEIFFNHVRTKKVWDIILFLIFGILLGSGSIVNATSTDFNYSGGQQSWTVPAGVNSVQIESWGAGSDSASGGYSIGTKAVSSGQTLYIYVGGTSGYNGGGGGGVGYSNGASGGGASDVRLGGTALANRIIVAGGAGGSGGGGGVGGAGGGTSGGSGGAGSEGGSSTIANQSSGNALGIGGSGADGDSQYSGGGGGGGGYYGGGGGVSGYDFGGGGYGGSGYIGGVTSGSMSTGVRSGNGLVRLTYTLADQNPVISLSTPITSQTYSAQTGYKTITITGKVSDPDGDNVTVSATINGKTKSTTVNSTPTSPPGSDNFTLTWDVASDSIAAGTYSSISVSADDGKGGTANATLTPNLTVDLTTPTVNIPASSSITSTSFAATANASDTAAPLKYLFNENGSDVGIWQASSSYSFIGLTANTPYTIKYKAQDAVGNISGYSPVLNVTTAATPSPQVPAARIQEVKDMKNNDNASDLRVIFWEPADITKIAAYKIIVSSGTIDETTADALSSTSYLSEPVRARNRMHLIYLPASLQTSGGGAINAAGGTYNVYVLSVAKTGYSDKLTTPISVTITTNNAGAKVEAPKPIITDISNNGNGTDLRVNFMKARSEINIHEYRIIASTITLDLATANSVPAAGYKSVTPTNPRSNYVVTLGSSQTIQDGTTPIQNGTGYKIYILAIGKNGYTNALSTPSNLLTLSQYVPGVAMVRALRVVKIGTGHDSSNINVTFYEPAANSNIQEYRIFIAPTASTLDETTAEGAASGLYQAVTPTRRSALHIVTLNGGLNDFTDTPLSAGTYKVCVLTVGKSGFASRLSGASANVTLD